MERNAVIAGALAAFGLFAIASAVAIGGVYWGLHGATPAVLAGAEGEAAERPRGRAARSEGAAAREVPTTEMLREQTAQPNAKYAMELIGPMTGIRRRLQSFGPEGDALGAPGDVTVGELRENNRNPDAHPWEELAADVQAFATSIRDSEWATDPAIAAQLTRIDAILAEHDAAVGGG